MPELAEVETVRRTLKKQILNKKIKDIKILYSSIIENKSFDIKSIINDEIIDIQRKGKYLIFETNNYYLISHLRMEGKFFIKPIEEDINKHEHVIFYFDDFTLRYHDTRKFGRMCLISKEKLNDYFANVGPDANLNPDINIVFKKISKSNLPIKTLLLDQSIIAGLGNIYVDEVLFKSSINPTRKGRDITLLDIENILKNSKLILDKAILEKGTTIRSYTSSLNVYGNYQKYLCVHTKEGNGCPICNTKIIKIKVGARGTYYCPKCQK